GQLMSLRYGTIPIVRATGGLADTIHDFDPALHPEGNGFVFAEYTGEALLACVRRAVATYQMKASRQTLVRRALSADFSWARSADRYAALYAEAKAAREARSAPAHAARLRRPAAGPVRSDVKKVALERR